MNFAVNTKDSILATLRDAIDLQDYMVKADHILDALMTTAGVWTECGYAYKATEIANIIGQRFTDEIGNCHHHKTHAKIDTMRIKAYTVARFFCEQQYEYREAQQAEIDAMLGIEHKTDMELAS